MKNYRYDLRMAFDEGIHEHPQKQMQAIGYEVIKSEPVTVADCWWFRVGNDIDSVPDYLTPMSDDFLFSDERNKKQL